MRGTFMTDFHFPGKSKLSQKSGLGLRNDPVSKDISLCRSLLGHPRVLVPRGVWGGVLCFVVRAANHNATARSRC